MKKTSLVACFSLLLLVCMGATYPFGDLHMIPPAPQYSSYDSQVLVFPVWDPPSHPQTIYIERYNGQTKYYDTAVDVDEDCKICFQLSVEVKQGDDVDVEARVSAKCQGATWVTVRTFRADDLESSRVTPYYNTHETTQPTLFGIPGTATLRVETRMRIGSGSWSGWDATTDTIEVNQVTE